MANAMNRYDYEAREQGKQTVYDIHDRRHENVPIATVYDHYHAERILKLLNAQG